VRAAARGFSAPAFDQGIFLLHLNKGREHLQRGDFDKARLELEEGLKLRPSDEMVLNLLGMVYFRLELRHEAVGIYRMLLTMHPEADILHSNLGILEFKEGNHDEAAKELTEALRLNPRNPKPHLYLGLIARLRGRDEECLEHLRQAGADALVARLRSARDAGRAASREADPPPSPLLAESQPDRGSREETVALGGEVLEFVRRGADFSGPGASTAPPSWGVLDLREIVEGQEKRRSLVGESLFALKGASSLEVAFLGRIGVRDGAVILASGEMRTSAILPGFTEIRGPGRVLVSGSNASILLFPLTAQRVYVSESRLLAWEGSLDVSAGTTSEQKDRASVRMSGTGSFGMGVGKEPLVVELRGGHPLRVAWSRLIAWTDDVKTGAEPAGEMSSIMGGEGSVALASGEGQILIDAA